MVAYSLLLGHFLSSGIAVILTYLLGISHLSLGIFIFLAMSWLAISLRYIYAHSDIEQWTTGKLAFKPWTRSTYILFLVLLLVAIALVFEPFANLGKKTDLGYAYRKYFPGDFLKMMAMTAELSKGDIPPENPWFAGESLHYYWWYFVPLSWFYRLIGMGISIKALVILSTLMTDALFLFALFSTLRLFTTRNFAPFLAALVGITAYSYESIYLWWHLGYPIKDFLEQARFYNIDGITRWFWGEPQMDGFLRSLLYSPPHLHALALLLAVISIFALSNVLQNLSLSCFAGLLIGVTVIYNTFIGLIVALWYGLWLGIQVIAGWARLVSNYKGKVTTYDPKRDLFSFLLSNGIAGLVVLLCYSLSMFVRGPDTGLMPYVGKALKTHGPLVFFINYGPPFIFGGVGIFLMWKRTRNRRSRIEDSSSKARSSIPSILLLLLLSIILVSTVALKGFVSDVGLKLGLVILIPLLIFSAISLEFLHQRLPALAFYSLLIIINGPALLTVLLDRYNLADIYNSRFTLYVSEEDMQAATWIKSHVPGRAIVQSSSPEGETPFTLVSVLGERRTAVGDKFFARIYQIPAAEVERRRGDITSLFETKGLDKALKALKKYSIDYIYVGEYEKTFYPEGIRKFYEVSDLFEKVYENTRVDIFKVHTSHPDLIRPKKFQVEVEEMKGPLGKIVEDPEASAVKAVVIRTGAVSSERWAFLLNQKFPPGNYTLSLWAKVQDNSLPDTIITWEVFANNQGDQKKLEISGMNFQKALEYQNLAMNFILRTEDTFKFRITYRGGTDIWIDSVVVTFPFEDRKRS